MSTTSPTTTPSATSMIKGAARERVIQKTMEYLDRPAVVGCELPFLDFMKREFDRLGCETSLTDHLLDAAPPGGAQRDPVGAHRSSRPDLHGAGDLRVRRVDRS